MVHFLGHRGVAHYQHYPCVGAAKRVTVDYHYMHMHMTCTCTCTCTCTSMYSH